jgi:ketosteroid isomerase-like protein
MVEIFCKEDCGNAPKKILLKALTSAFARGTAQRELLPLLSEEVVWEFPGADSIQGKDSVAAMLAQAAASGNKASKLEIENIITHGKAGSVNGTISMADGKQYAFCDIYLWSSASAKSPIKKITSFNIEVKSESSA